MVLDGVAGGLGRHPKGGQLMNVTQMFLARHGLMHTRVDGLNGKG